MMYTTLINYINRETGSTLKEDEIELIKKHFSLLKIKKRHFFLQQGEVCKYSGFIVKGSMKQYSTDDKGIEHIVHLYIENWWPSDRESFITNTPSIYNIDALEDTTLLVVSREGAIELNKIPVIAELTRIMDEKNAFAYKKRINSAISMTAEQRYLMLLKNYPDFLQRFPQHMIASYLGIKKETLSRIRSQMFKNKD